MEEEFFIMTLKRKHHIIPATYLSGFTDKDGKLYEYRADEPANPRYAVPRELGHRRDYYSQPFLNGETDYNTLEDFFDKSVESKWADIIKKIKNKEKLTSADITILFQFIGMLKGRVPATRDSVEHLLATVVRQTGERLEESGELPSRPEGLKDMDWSDFDVSIDPHQSIHAMGSIIEGFSTVLDSVNFVIYHNHSNISFVTSDNPVVYFDPTIPEKEMNPYLSSLLQIELIFPLSSKMILHGHSNYTNVEKFSYHILKSEFQIRRFNRMICRFAYEKFYSQDRSHEPLINRYADISPVLNFDKMLFEDGKLLNLRFIFGQRRKLSKWRKPKK
jgi:hypothetical protein